MQWISENWLLVLLIGGAIGAHFFLHGRGGHGGGHGGKRVRGHSHQSGNDQHLQANEGGDAANPSAKGDPRVTAEKPQPRENGS